MARRGIIDLSYMWKTKQLTVRVTDAEREYLRCLADCICDGNISEAFRWVLHQSLLLAVADTPELRKLSRRLQKGIAARQRTEKRA